jgi:hypothetical protein
MIKHFHMMLAVEGIRILKEDNAKLVEENATFKAIIAKHQSVPVESS